MRKMVCCEDQLLKENTMSVMSKFWRLFLEALEPHEPCKHERTYTISDPIATCEQQTTYCKDCFEKLNVKIDC